MARALTAALVALALGGCGGERGLSFQVFGGAEELAAYEQVVRAYEQSTGEEVDLIGVPDRDAHLAKLTTGFAAGRPPDVFLLNYRNYGPFQARGVLEPIGGRIDTGGYYDSPVEAFSSGGELQCLPQNASSLVVYWNRDLFEAAQATPPQEDWTWQQFLATARRLRGFLAERAREQRAQHGLLYAAGLDPSVVRLAPFIWSTGGELVDDVEAPTAWALDTPEAHAGAERFLELFDEVLVPTEAEVEAQPLEEMFVAGRIAMFFSSRREVPSFREIEAFEWDVAPFPSIDEPVTVLHSDAFCLARGDRAEDALRFVRFAGGRDGQRILARSGRIVPSLRAVAESPDFLQSDRPPRSARVFLDQIDVMRRLPATANWPRIEDAATLAFKRAYYLELSAEQAIARIEAETRGLF